jgi:hypothetical protein
MKPSAFHTRQLGLFRGHIFVAWWLDIPLSQASLALQDGHNISQIRRWFLLFRRWTGTLLSVLERIAISSATTLKCITISSTAAAAATTSAILKQISVSARPLL